METNNIQQKESIFKKPWMHSLVSFLVIFGLLGIFIFWQVENTTVFIENSDLEAPIVNLSPTLPGTLNALYVKEGDHVTVGREVALVGTQAIFAKNDGIVSFAQNVIGTYFGPGQTVVSIVNNGDMKVVGQIDETKGLNRLAVGQEATFSVDAFPGKTYKGILDEISPVSNDNGVIFSISDQRPVKKFDVKVRFNLADYPELKSGMSAKITIYIK